MGHSFAQKQHFTKIALLSRNPENLEAQAKEVRKLSGDKVEVHAIPADLNDFAGLRKALGEIEKLGPLGGIFFNAARINPTELLTTSVEEIEEDFRVSCMPYQRYQPNADRPIDYHRSVVRRGAVGDSAVAEGQARQADFLRHEQLFP